MPERMVTMTFEPSERLSAIIGFPYFLERKVPISELNLTPDEIKEMESGKTIKKSIPIIMEE